MTRFHLASFLVALAGALMLASSATAAGEAKNVAPFTHKVTPVAVASVAGEPKNQAPFTRTASRVPYVPDWFERYAAAHPYGQDLTTTNLVTKESHAFSWRDAFAGAAVTTLLALVVIAIGRTRRAHYKHVLRA